MSFNPVRVVSLVPSLTLAVHQLGRGDTLVAVTRFCRHPEPLIQDLETIGGTKDPDLERILELEPDLVLANTDEQRAETLDALADTDLEVLVTETDSLDEVEATWTQLGAALVAQAVAEQERQALAQARSQVARQQADLDRVPVLVPVWREPWVAAGPGTYIDDLVSTSGFINVVEADERWPRIELDGLPATPQAALLPTEPYRFTDEHRQDLAPAGLEPHQVRVVDGELMTWWLTHTVEALHHLAELADDLAATTSEP